MTATLRVAIRADAAPRIGLGHFVRCLTLADRLTRAGAQVRFICREVSEGLASDVRHRGHELVVLPPCSHGSGRVAAADPPHAAWLDCDWEQDALATRAALGAAAWDWMVVDHYALDARWESKVHDGAERILVIDDLADRAHDCDVLLDQNLQAPSARRYASRVAQQCRLLLGPRFALLRPEFSIARSRCAPRERLRRILVFFGGADRDNLTQIAIEAFALGRWPDVSMTVVAGSLNPRWEELQRRCAALPNVTFYRETDAMAELMAAADLAIGAAGTTSWERCCLGLPAIVVSVADNQREVARELARARVALQLDQQQFTAARLAKVLDRFHHRPQLLQRMSRRAARLVDGRGADRVGIAMLDRTVSVRTATLEDGPMAWRWRNSAEVRRVSFDTSEIPLPSHLAWWRETLQSSERRLLVGEVDGTPLGIVRFDLLAGAARLSIYLDPELTGVGIGPQLLTAACRWLFGAQPGITRIEAQVRAENRASRRAFARAGFREEHSGFVLEQERPS
jgi:UDP-2,4-diacetamido-2,4,6-trideoxy-beta-L-altropyranose hydrolase